MNHLVRVFSVGTFVYALSIRYNLDKSYFLHVADVILSSFCSVLFVCLFGGL